MIGIAKRLGIKGVKTLQAEYLFSLVREKKVTYGQIKDLDPKRFADLEYTMKLIFNHDEDALLGGHGLGPGSGSSGVGLGGTGGGNMFS